MHKEGVKKFMSKWLNLIPRPRSKFLRIKCPDCGNEQVIFNQSKMIVRCNVCGGILSEPKGGKAKLRGEIVSSLE